MCANCKPVGIKLDGDQLVTVYAPMPADGVLSAQEFDRLLALSDEQLSWVDRLLLK